MTSGAPGRRPVAVVLRALGLGDLLTAVPALRALRRAFPAHHLVLAAPAALEPLARLSGAVDEVADVGPLEPLPPRLHGADVAVNLHGRGPQSTAVLQAARPRRLIAWGAGWRPDEHEVARWCRLLEENGIPADPSDLRLPAPGPPPFAGRPLLVHPGAASPARRWPVERFAEVVRAAGADAVVTAGPGEESLAARVGAPVLANLPLTELAAAVAGARAVLCGDTGVSHLATAMGTPSVTLFGPTPPSLWGPPPSPRHRVLWRGRTGDPHGRAPDPGLLDITVAEVLGELRRAL